MALNRFTEKEKWRPLEASEEVKEAEYVVTTLAAQSEARYRKNHIDLDDTNDKKNTTTLGK